MVSCCIPSTQSDFILCAFSLLIEIHPNVFSGGHIIFPRDTWWTERIPRPTSETTHHLWDKLRRSLGKDNGRGGLAALQTASSLCPVRAGDQFSYKVRRGPQETHLLPLLQSHPVIYPCFSVSYDEVFWNGSITIKRGDKNEVSTSYQVEDVKVYRNIWKMKMGSHREQLNTCCNLGRRHCF